MRLTIHEAKAVIWVIILEGLLHRYPHDESQVLRSTEARMREHGTTTVASISEILLWLILLS